jgi:4-amino-4-deoxy-L-arabinose transferase-like glycosyltransferase
MVAPGRSGQLRMWDRDPRVTLVVVSLLLGGTMLAYPRTSLDNSTYTYVAQTILHGGMPYHDAWDVKGPAIFYAYAVQLLLFGKSSVALQVMDLLWQLATAFVAFAIGRRASGQQEVGLLAGVLYLIVFYSQSALGITMTGQTDGYLSLPLALSVLYLLRAHETDRPLAWALSGAWVAVATLFKLPFGLMGVCMIIAALTGARVSASQAIRRLASLAVGFAAPLAVCALYFYWKGALADLWDAQIFASLYHVKLNQNGHYLDCILTSFTPPVRIPLYTLTLLSVVPATVTVLRRHRLAFATKILLGWFAVGWIVFFLHGSVLAYHFTPILAPAAVLSAETLFQMYRATGTGRKSLRWLATAAVFVLLSCLAWRTSKNILYEWRALHGHRPPQWADALGAYVKQHTTPQDTVFVWGSVPSVYLDSGRKAASRFEDAYHVALPPEGLNYREIFLGEFTAAEPKYFILETRARPGGPCGFEEADFKQTFEDFTPLREIIERDYQLEPTRQLGPFDLYRRKN